MAAVTEDVLKYFTRKQFFPGLATWTLELDALYAQYPLLRNLMVDGIDLKESPTMNFQDTQMDLYERLGIRIERDEAHSEGSPGGGRSRLVFDVKRFNYEGLSPTLINVAKQSIRQNKSITAVALERLTQMHYYNKVIKHREMGFASEVLIYDAYRFWDWAASIANLCNSFLPVFEKLVKREVFLFPFLDKAIQESISACNSFMAFLQVQQQMLQQKNLNLDETDTDFINQTVKPVDLNHPNGGILAPLGSHVLLKDPLFETSNGKVLYLDIPAEATGELQPSWTITKWYVQPGDKLLIGAPIIHITTMNIRADEPRFKKLLQDIYRQLSRIRKTGIMLKDAVEEEMRTGGGVAQKTGDETSGFKPQINRFSSIDQPSEQEVKETSQELSMPEAETKETIKRIRKAKSRLTNTR